ncbi:acyltransferase family protein [Microbacterium karelineae]|uniref:acyltransferase family protein n=1 Tax=Microbacterium karelineae TaxID=2654283 RepID=UPI0012EAE265|nr:acyltransferase family protein [Microbacterium karelineae]
MIDTTAVRPRDETRAPQAPSTWRPDIQGLRALAVVLVVIAHVGTPGFEGGFIGVDIFFVISGFLITQLLLREVDRSGTVSITQFYVRRARRILPAATVVTAAVVVYAAIFLPLGRLHEAAADAGWSSVFLANWHFALSGTDYFSVSDPSLFQHYWSLAVEEQFYLVWPLLVLAFVPRVGRRAFTAAAAIVFAGSLAYSVWATGVAPEATYFNTAARAFELSGGALLACALASPLASRWRHGSATIGILLIAIATVAFSEQTPFPGWYALVPVAGTMLLLSAGPDTWTGRALSWRPVRYIGDISFSLYLWHWPVAMAVEAAAPHDAPFLATAAATIAVSMFLAALTFHYVERPFQTKRVPAFSRDRRTLWLWPISVAVVLSVAFGAAAFGDARQAAQQAAAEEYFDEHGYQQVEGQDVDEVQEELGEAVEVAESGAPIPPDIDSDELRAAMWTDVADGDCYASEGEQESDVCFYGDTDASTTVALVGDSHAAMWLPALDIIGQEHDFRVALFAKMACGAYPAIQDADGHNQDDCDAFRAFTRDEVEDLRPDAVVLGARGQLNMADRDGETVDEQWADAVTEAVTGYQAVSDRVIALGDVPARDEAEPKDCVDSPGGDQSDCVVSGESIEAHSNDITQERVDDAGAVYLDTAGFVCTDDGCPLFAGDVPLYEDSSHLNRLWVEHIAPALGRELEDALN